MPPVQHKSIDGFLASLDDELRVVVQELRALILAANPEIQEGIKWNCLSFRLDEWFAAVNVRPVARRPAVLLVLHTGAKVKETAQRGLEVPDPRGLLEWLAPDRAALSFSDGAALAERRDALVEILKTWILQTRKARA